MPEPTYPFWHYKRHPEAFGALLAAFVLSQSVAIITFDASLPSRNALGLVGHCCAYVWLSLCGVGTLLGVFGFGLFSYHLFQRNITWPAKYHVCAALGCLFSSCLIATLMGHLIPSMEQYWLSLFHVPRRLSWQFGFGGMPMAFLYKHIPYLNLENLLGTIGTALVSCVLLFISLIGLFDVPLQLLWKKKPETKPVPQKKEKREKETPVSPNEFPERQVRFGIDLESDIPDNKNKRSIDPITKAPLWPLAAQSGIPVLPERGPKRQDLSTYLLPSIDLLNSAKKVDVSELKRELKEKADLLELTLMNFGIEAKVGQIHCGPTITMFEVHPAVGVKVGKIKTLEHDIALNMEAKSIRIIAPIPGKAAVGIEIPNQTPQEVNFREVLAAYQQRGAPFKIPMLLGKAVNGELVLADLTKMPHCIIAGATGSGKSVCINSIIVSILMLAKPDEIRFLMVDPKKVELAPYSELPHMVAPVITEPHTAAAALNWLVKEMEKRYEILRITGHRNIESFNKRERDLASEEKAHVTVPEKFNYIVGIIDELADLMMVANQDVEAPIARIAQMARAVGIHLILATQRPSREVITGLIKANFPARIAFKVASRVNSQIILDDIGAETLLGNGDMLILLPGSSQSIRAQGVFVRDEEINKVIQTISRQVPPNYIIGSVDKFDSERGSGPDIIELDGLFEEAKSTVLQTGNASTTFLQRKLKIGYARAASIMDQLEQQGIVSAQDGARPRRILYQKEAKQVGDSSAEYDEREDER